MTSEPAGVSPMVDGQEKAEIIRSALERDYDSISRAVGAAVRAVGRGQNRLLFRQRTEEVLGESCRRALESSASYDPNKSVVGWIVGIARNVMKGEARDRARRPGLADLDEAAWQGVLGIIDRGTSRVADHLDVERMLERLKPQDRQAIECRYLRGIQGEQLVVVLGAASEGAARLRVFRATRALRDLFARDGLEVGR